MPATLLHRFQAVLTVAARLAYNQRRSERNSDALICLRWLLVPKRIRFQMAVLVYRALRGLLPA